MTAMRYFVVLGVISLLLQCTNRNNSNSYFEYDFLVWQAMLNKKEGNRTEALSLFKQAITVIPNDDSSPYFNAAALAFSLNQQEEAIELLE